MAKNTTVVSGGRGIGFFGLLTIAFIVLKLCDVIAWSWIWVLAPLWIPFVLGLSVLVIVLVVVIIAAIIAAIIGKK